MKKFFYKLYDFVIYYEDILKFSFLLFVFMVITLLVAGYFDKQLSIEKNIIQNTKEYVIFDKCKLFDNSYYCWNVKE